MKNYVENAYKDSGEERDEDLVISLCIHWQNLGPDFQDDPEAL